MRHILVDHARQAFAAKHGGGHKPLPLEEVIALPVQVDVNLLALDEALKELEKPVTVHLHQGCLHKSPSIHTASELELDDVEPARQRCSGDVAAMAAELEVSERALRRRLGQLGLL